jgi:hypothetical protein
MIEKNPDQRLSISQVIDKLEYILNNVDGESISVPLPKQTLNELLLNHL